MKFILFYLVLIPILACQIRDDKLTSKEYLKSALDTARFHANHYENYDSIKIIRLAIANTLLDSAIENDMHNINAYFWKSSFQLQLKDYNSALNTATSGINNYSDKPNNILINLHVQRAVLNLHLNKTDSYKDLPEALSYYNDQIKKDNSDVEAILNKATVLCYMDKKEEAIAYLQSISNLDFELDEVINDMKNLNYRNILQKL